MTDVLYDVPGPRARRRILVGAVLGGLVLAFVVAVALKRFADHGQFESAKWQAFTVPGVPKFIALGVVATVRAAAAAMAASILVGLLLALGRMSRLWLVRWPTTIWLQFFRSVPVLLLILFSALGLPKLGVHTSIFTYLVIGLALYNSTVIAEIIRAGVRALPRGQTEAALAVGLTERQALRLVVLPQAVRAMLPALASQLVTILKDTAYGFVIGYEELLRRSQNIGDFYPGTLLPAYLVAAVLYILLCFLVSTVAHRLAYRSQRKTAARAVEARLDTDI